MTEDARLTDFVEDVGDGSDEDEPAESEFEPESEDEELECGTDGDDCEGDRQRGSTDRGAPDVEPATTTYAWGSYACARCEGRVDRVWEGESGLVCESCKEW